MKSIEDNFDKLFPDGCDIILDEFKVGDECPCFMIRRRDDGILPELVDWMQVVRQSVIADGLASLTGCRREYTMNDESMFFGVVDFKEKYL